MNVKEAIESRRTIRKYKNRLVPDELLLDILETAKWSPSPVNSQPWQFIIIKDKKTLKTLTEHAKYGSHLIDAPMAVVIVATHVEHFHWYNEIEENKYAGVILAGYLMLAAWERGVGTGWVSVSKEEVNKVLDVPEGHTVIAIITMGYPEEGEPRGEEGRKSVGSMMFSERFGERFPRIDT